VLVRAQQREGAAASLGPFQRGEIRRCDMAFASLAVARRDFMGMIAAEQMAGNYAVLLGWEEAEPAAAADETFLGTLQVHGLKILPAR